MKKFLLWAGAAIVLSVAAGGLWAFARHESRPTATPGPEAEAFAQAMLDAVNIKAWKRTGAVRFEFGSRHKLLWDRERGFARVAWEDTEVDLEIASKRGIPKVGGKVIEGAKAAELLGVAAPEER